MIDDPDEILEMGSQLIFYYHKQKMEKIYLPL